MGGNGASIWRISGYARANDWHFHECQNTTLTPSHLFSLLALFAPGEYEQTSHDQRGTDTDAPRERLAEQPHR
jgi:hypothetical protein